MLRKSINIFTFQVKLLNLCTFFRIIYLELFLGNMFAKHMCVHAMAINLCTICTKNTSQCWIFGLFHRIYRIKILCILYTKYAGHWDIRYVFFRVMLWYIEGRKFWEKISWCSLFNFLNNLQNSQWLRLILWGHLLS